MAFAKISANVNGSNALVAAVPGKRIRVTSYVLLAAGTVNATFQSAANDLTGAFPLVAQAGVAAQVTPSYPGGAAKGWFETNVGEALNLSLDAGVLVAGHLSYEYANC